MKEEEEEPWIPADDVYSIPDLLVVICGVDFFLYRLFNDKATFSKSVLLFSQARKWGATARYYASPTKTMLPTRKSVPRSSRQPFRVIKNLSYKEHVSNEEVHAKIQQAIGPHEELLTMVKRRKLQWYGHVSRSSGLAKTVLQGTMKGGRRQGRQRKRWEDNIREWTGLKFAKSQRAVKNRGKWRKLVAKSSVVPQRPSCSKDRWHEKGTSSCSNISDARSRNLHY